MARSNIAVDRHKAAGVDIGEADAGIRNIVARVTATWPQSGFGAVQLPIGYFANVIDIGGIGLAITHRRGRVEGDDRRDDAAATTRSASTASR